MGRQAYLTRLALGLSAFEDPELDDTGDFILGSHAHDLDAEGYVQQFNARGHPENKASKAAARELRRAKNDVLSVAGVIKQEKDNAEATARRKVDLIIRETEYGLGLAGMDLLIMFAALWWLVSLRRRIQVGGISSLQWTDRTDVHYADLQELFHPPIDPDNKIRISHSRSPDHVDHWHSYLVCFLSQLYVANVRHGGIRGTGNGPFLESEGRRS